MLSSYASVINETAFLKFCAMKTEPSSPGTEGDQTIAKRKRVSVQFEISDKNGTIEVPKDLSRVEKIRKERAKIFSRLIEVKADLARTQAEHDAQMLKNSEKTIFSPNGSFKEQEENSSMNFLNPNVVSGSLNENGLTLNNNDNNDLTPKHEIKRRHSFQVDGMTEDEVAKHVSHATSHHARSIEHSDEKIVLWIRTPRLLEETHEHSFYELFYDLILAVVFIKLSYLKYHIDVAGFFVVMVIFANFWSCWSLLNIYATMFHAEDVLHRVYYISHISAAFLMAISVQNPEFDFFNFRYMAGYHAIASIIGRVMTLMMWGYSYKHDLVKTRHDESNYEYETKDVKKQLSVHFYSILCSIFLFFLTYLIPFDYNVMGGSTSHWPTIILWFLAIIIEQVGNSYGAIYMQLPFSAMYAGARMQNWLMLCFGESVIALLMEPIFYDITQLASILAAFFMILCLCTTYFDIVDADQFLHLLVVRKEKFKAILFMNFQFLFSFSVFLVGVSLKTIIYVSNTVYLKENNTGCGVKNHNEAAHRKLLSFITSEAALITNHEELFENTELKSFRDLTENDVLSVAHISDSILIDDESSEWFGGVNRMLSGGGDATDWMIHTLDKLLVKSVWLLCFSVVSVMISSMLIGYSMPTKLAGCRTHFSRISALLVSAVSLVIPMFLKTIATPCLLEADGINQYETKGLTSDQGGMSVVKVLSLISLIIFTSFFVALISVDPNREASYAKLEEDAHYEETVKHLSHVAKNAVHIITKRKTTLSFRFPFLRTDHLLNKPKKNEANTGDDESPKVSLNHNQQQQPKEESKESEGL